MPRIRPYCFASAWTHDRPGPALAYHMRRGYSLVELLIVVIVAGTLALLALPPIAVARDRLAVDAATRALVDAHHRARLIASTERRTLQLRLSAEWFTLHLPRAPGDTIERWRHSGPAAEGVSATGFPHQVTIAPSGLPLGLANNTYTLTRGAARRQVVVSRYGRVQVR